MGVNINSIKRKLLIKYPSFGKFIENLQFVENTDIKTAATDGKVVKYNPTFVEKLNIYEQLFLFAHEVCHVALEHILRSKNKNKKIWNIATDAVINAWLVKDKLSLIEGGVDIPEAIEMDSEELYQLMIEIVEETQKKQNNENNQKQDLDENTSEEGQNESEKGQNTLDESVLDKIKDDSNVEMSDNLQDVGISEQQKSLREKIKKYLKGIEKSKGSIGHDCHDLWEKALEEETELSNNQGESEIQEETTEQGKTERKSDKKVFEENKKIREKNQAEFEKTLLHDSVISQGGETSVSKRKVTNIGIARPLINWTVLLKEAIKSNEEITRRNARIRNGVFKYRVVEEPIYETEIVLDTSGSISSELLKNFLRECRYIIEQSRVKVGCFDTRFYGFTEISSVRDIEKMEFPGGGRTDFDVAVEAFSRNATNKIIFTDGKANMPKKPVDAIWVVMGYKKINPVRGKVIRITGEQLEKLRNGRNTKNR